MSTPEAKCSGCGAYYQGWALLNQRYQTCSRCGTKLKIAVDGQTFEGYSPFDAERLSINLPTDIPSSGGDKKAKRGPKKQGGP